MLSYQSWRYFCFPSSLAHPEPLPCWLGNLRKLSSSRCVFVVVLLARLLPINITKLMWESHCGWNWVVPNWLPSFPASPRLEWRKFIKMQTVSVSVWLGFVFGYLFRFPLAGRHLARDSCCISQAYIFPFDPRFHTLSGLGCSGWQMFSWLITIGRMFI